MSDIEFAKDQSSSWEAERKSLGITEHERKATAYHEAGPAIGS